MSNANKTETLTIEQIREDIEPLLVKYGVKHAEIYGSFARGQQNTGSDLDILVDFGTEHAKTLYDLISLKLEVQEALGVEVDINTIKGISPLIRDKIQKDKVSIL
jgi:hypothetical protein